MQAKIYSYTLVSLQFIIIILLLILNTSVFTEFLPLLLFITGINIGIYAITHNPLSNFNIIPDIKENAQLITTGIYGYIRHPMYFSVSIMMLSVFTTSFTLLNLVLYLILILALTLKANKEEMLWNKKSKEYQDYMSKTKRFIPFIL